MQAGTNIAFPAVYAAFYSTIPATPETRSYIVKQTTIGMLLTVKGVEYIINNIIGNTILFKCRYII